jgi:hypothetical protein
MTRTKALLYAFFGPFVTLLPGGMLAAILVGAARETSTSASTAKLLYTIAILVGIAALIVGFAIRVKHARWYVLDKKQPEGWKWVSLAGVWGFVVLMLITDRALAPPVGSVAGAPPAISADSHPGSKGLSNRVAYLLLAVAVLLTGLMIWSGFQK